MIKQTKGWNPKRNSVTGKKEEIWNAEDTGERKIREIENNARKRILVRQGDATRSEEFFRSAGLMHSSRSYHIDKKRLNVKTDRRMLEVNNREQMHNLLHELTFRILLRNVL
jgi:hypothetical protein